jgi:1-acyl-sn-glycerol-3-phosphate acyltransferase
VLGAEHLAAMPGRVIFAGTHRSYADLFLLQSALAETPSKRFARRLVVATAATRYGAAGALAKLAMLAFGLYPLDQYRNRDASLRGLVDLARHDNAVLIFPQGRHVAAALEQAGDSAAHFRPGVGQLAAALDAVVVPFGVAGSDAIIPPNPPPGFAGPVVAGIPLTMRRGPLAIAFGPPLRPGPDEDPRAFAARLEVTCFVLSRRAEDAIADLE